jgi:hypothetical protein
MSREQVKKVAVAYFKVPISAVLRDAEINVCSKIGHGC